MPNRDDEGTMTDVKSGLGRVIKQLRRQRGLTQDELAEKASLHRTYLSDVERGTRNLSIISLHRISAALGTPLSDIFKQVENAFYGSGAAKRSDTFVVS